MTILMGDVFRGTNEVLQVYGFKVPDGRERLMLVVSDEGERGEREPWDLMENYALDPGRDENAEVLFDTEKHGRSN